MQNVNNAGRGCPSFSVTLFSNRKSWTNRYLPLTFCTGNDGKFQDPMPRAILPFSTQSLIRFVCIVRRSPPNRYDGTPTGTEFGVTQISASPKAPKVRQVLSRKDSFRERCMISSLACSAEGWRSGSLAQHVDFRICSSIQVAH